MAVSARGLKVQCVCIGIATRGGRKVVGRNVGQRSTGGGGHGISAVAWITGEDVDCVSARRAGEGTTCLRVLIANGPSINGRLHFLEALPSLESVGPWFGAHGICPSRLQAQTQHFLLIPALAGFLSWAAAVCWTVPPAACFLFLGRRCL